MIEEPYNCFRLPPFCTVTSGRNLARLISDESLNSSKREQNSNYPPRAPWNNQDDSENPFSKDDNSKQSKYNQNKVPR